MRCDAVVDYNQRAVKIDQQPANLSRSNRPDILFQFRSPPRVRVESATKVCQMIFRGS